MPTVPNEYLSNQSFIGLALETTFGTAVSATSYVPFTSESLAGKPNIKNIPSIRQTRSEMTAKFTGPYEVSGDLVFPFYPTSGGILLAGALGHDTYSTSTHNLTVSDGALPSFTIEKYLAGVTDATVAGAASNQFAGMVVSKYSMKLAVEAAAECTVTFMGQQNAFIAPSSPSFGSDVTPYSLLHISVTIGGTSSPFITAVDLDIDNSAKALTTFQNSRYPALVYGGARKVSGKFTVAMQNTAMLLQAFNGTLQTVVVTLSQDGSHSVVITMQNVLLGDTTEQVKLGEVVMEEIPFEAYVVGSYKDISIAMKNDTGSGYGF
jgi:hypothetical protein